MHMPEKDGSLGPGGAHPKSGRLLVQFCCAVVCVVLSLALSGCFAGAAGVALGLAEALDEDNGSVNRPPLVLGIEPTRWNGDLVLVRYDLVDDDGGPLDVRVEWQPADLSLEYQDASEYEAPVKDQNGAPVESHGTEKLETEPNKPRATIFVWDARRDLRSRVGRDVARVRLRITAIEGATTGEAGVSAPFDAGNEAPVVLSVAIDPDIQVDPRSGAVSGIVPLLVAVYDSTSDPVQLASSFRFHRNDAARCMTLASETEPAPPGAGAPCTTSRFFTTAPADQGGRTHKIFWNTFVDVGDRARPDIKVKMIPHDLFDPHQGEGYWHPVPVDNNNDPEVEILSVAGAAADRHFEIPIRLLVKDEDRHSVTVLLQWARQGEPFPDLSPVVSSLENPSMEELEAIDEILRAREAVDDDRHLVALREQLHILSEAPVVLHGTLDDSSELPANKIRATDFVRQGLVFRPPTPGGSRRLQTTDMYAAQFEGDLEAQAEDPRRRALLRPVTRRTTQSVRGVPFGGRSDVFLIGREIRFPTERGSENDCFRISRFDPRTSVATLDRDVELEPGARYTIRANGGAVKLSSSRKGHLHTFVWDSLKDIPVSMTDVEVNIRALAFDSQGTEAFGDSPMTLNNSPLVKSQDFPGEPSNSVAIGDVNGDGLQDVAVVHLSAESLEVFYQERVSGRLRQGKSWNLTGEGPLDVAVGDVGEVDATDRGLSDVVVANFQGDTLAVFYQNRSGELVRDSLLPTGSHPNTLAIGDVDGDGRNDVLVANTQPNGEGFYTVSRFLQKNGNLTGTSRGKFRLTPALPLETSGEPVFVAIGDMDGDGLHDVVVANKDSAGSGTLLLFYQSPSHELVPTPPPLETGASPFAVAIGDLDGDGHNDLVATGRGTLTVFYQDPGAKDRGGRFPPRRRRTLSVSGLPTMMRLADLNRDFRLDIVAVGQTPDAVHVFLQESSAGFPEVATLAFSPGFAPLFMATGDVNADTRDDVVLVGAREGVNGMMSVYLQNSPGALPAVASGEPLRVEDRPKSLEVGDLNGDGRNDLLVTGNIQVVFYLQDRFGLLPVSPNGNLSVESPSSAAMGDVNGDGRNDVVVGEGSQLSVFLQGANGEVPERPSRTLTVSGGTNSLAVGDVNGDGRNDVVVASGSESAAYLQDASGHLPSSPSLPPIVRPGETLSVLVNDLDGDGRQDLILLDGLSGQVTVYSHGDGDGSGFQPQLARETAPSARLMAAADLDDDGRNDLVVVHSTTLVLLRANSAWTASAPLQLREQPKSVVIGDADGDGRSDILLGNGTSPTVTVLLQNPERALGSTVQTLRTGHEPGISAVAIGDVTGDGRNEVIVANNATVSDEDFYRISVFPAR